MGIQGLTSFIDEHPKLLTDYQLHDTQVVVDGNNLYHFLYYYFSVSHQYGGDYDHYARSVRFFFETFRECGISPVIVFDGGYDVDDRKLQTMLRRARERIHLAGFLSHAGRGRILPIMAYETFKMVLDELGIQHVTCDNEADNEIAALANAWGCPVLSNDSDFFVFDLTHGFVLLDYLNLTIQTSRKKANKTDAAAPDTNKTSVIGHRYLKAQIYHLNTLLARFPSMERRQIALFGTLLGNDYVPKKLFEAFYAGMKVSRDSVSMVSHHKKRSQFGRLLAWLESVGTVNESLRSLLSYIPADKHDTIKPLILRSVDSYTKFDTNLLDHFRTDAARTAMDFTVRTYLGNDLPTWFLEGVRCGRLPVLFVNIARLHRVIFLSQVEKMTECSAYSTVLQLRRLLYGILLSTDKNCCDVIKIGKKKKVDYVEEYDRVGKTQTRICVEPLFDLPGGRGVPSLEVIPELDLNDRRAVFYSALGLGDTITASLCCDRTNFLLAVIMYWAKHTVPAISWLHIYCLVACWLKLSIADVNTAEDKSQTKQHAKEDTKEGGSTQVLNTSATLTMHDTDLKISSEAHISGVLCDEGSISGNMVDTGPRAECMDNRESEDGTRVVDHPGDSGIVCRRCCLLVSPACAEIRVLATSSTTEVVEDAAKTRNSRISACDVDCLTASRNLQRFTTPPGHNRVRPFDGAIIHSFSQFQACFLYIHYLNVILREPLPSVSIAHVFNGTFLYSLCHELNNRQEPFLYICELLGRKSDICACFIEVIDVLKKLLPEDTVKEKQQMGKKNRRKRGRASQVVETGASMNVSDDSVKEGCVDEAAEVEVKCSVTNRFNMLVIDDDDDAAE